MPYSRICRNCQKGFISKRPNALVCSDECRLNWALGKSRRFSLDRLSNGTVGAISEMVVAVDLMKKGYAVFRSLSPACFCDLMAVKGDSSLRVEVKTGYESETGRVHFPKSNRPFDILATYVRETERIVYYGQDYKPSPLLEACG